MIVSRGALNLLNLSQVISNNLRDRQHGDAATSETETVHYGPSTINKVLSSGFVLYVKLTLV